MYAYMHCHANYPHRHEANVAMNVYVNMKEIHINVMTNIDVSTTYVNIGSTIPKLSEGPCPQVPLLGSH